MGMLRKIALGVVVISILTFTALFGRLPALRDTPIGAFHRMLVYRLPVATQRVDHGLTGGRLTSSFTRLGIHLTQDRHPYVMVFFLTLLTLSAGLFLSAAWGRVAPFPHHITIPIMLGLPYAFTFLTATSTASRITAQNHQQHFHAYPFDHTLYQPATLCRTCHFEKPARSKHCPLCGVCIARHDHHCAWVNTCIGGDNYRWFMGLLASLTGLLGYGALLGFALLTQNPAFSRSGNRNGLLGWFDKFAIALSSDIDVGAVCLLAAFTAPLAFGLMLYHVYLMWAGMTTNETSKWADLRQAMDEGTVWKAKKLYDADTDGVASAWPRPSRQIVAVFYDDGHPSSLELSFVQKETWAQCSSLADIDNTYDLGLMDNVRDAMKIR